MPDDFSANISTLGRAVLNGSVSGEIETGTDEDWFSIELEAGQTYRIDLEGTASDNGTLRDPYFRGIYTSSGASLGHANDDSGVGLNSRTAFTPMDTGTFFLSAGSYNTNIGTYTLTVTQLLTLSGTDSNDWISLPGGATLTLFGISGGIGVDMMSFAGLNTGITTNLHTDLVRASGPTSFSLIMDSIENVTGTSFDDIFYGSDRSEEVRGLGGRDLFYGSDGENDTIDGGASSDMLSYQNSNTAVSVSLFRGRGWSGDAAGDEIINVENLTGTNHDDFLWGDNADNKLVGLGGDDVITGAGGDDYILAGLGTDTIVYSGNRADYSITQDGIRTEVEHLNNGVDGHDVIGHAEVLRFADGDFIL